MKKSQWLPVSLNIFPHLALCLNAEQFDQIQRSIRIPREKREPFNPTPGGAIVHTFMNSAGTQPACIVCLGENLLVSHPANVFGMLAHEAVHVWQHCIEHIGERAPSKEFEAYGIQTITTALIRDFLEQSKWTVSFS